MFHIGEGRHRLLLPHPQVEALLRAVGRFFKPSGWAD